LSDTDRTRMENLLDSVDVSSKLFEVIMGDVKEISR
jgi:hypothetical protein